MKPSIPKGTRDFGPIEMARRNYIFSTIRSVFALYGFSQIETPAMENLSTLMGKYGEEGDKLLFKILDSGDYLRGVDPQLLAEADSLHLTSKISEKGLRYDLTVPFARFVVQHRNDLNMPFKRFQIQPVWRADRPQRGRYREFYQCDADVVGSDSLINEIELIELVDEVFARLGIAITIKLNNRKVLSGIAELVGAPEKLTDITVAIDKIDKIGLDKVEEELRQRGLSDQAVEAIRPILAISGSTAERLDSISQVLASSETGMLGIEEMRQVIGGVEALGLRAELELDVSLARGLNYYTGTIIEVKARDVEIGSITGGGRYDNLTGVFGMPGLSGVGISFGADRIYDVMLALGLFPETVNCTTRLLFVNLGEREEAASLALLGALRRADIAAEIYPEAVKMKKQMEYANRRAIPIVAIVGSQELEERVVTLKQMQTGEQRKVPFEQLVAEVAGM